MLRRHQKVCRRRLIVSHFFVMLYLGECRKALKSSSCHHSSSPLLVLNILPYSVRNKYSSSIWDPLFFAVCSARCLSFILFLLMQANISISFSLLFFRHKTLLLRASPSLVPPPPPSPLLSLQVPGDSSLRMAALICRKTS